MGHFSENVFLLIHQATEQFKWINYVVAILLVHIRELNGEIFHAALKCAKDMKPVDESAANPCTLNKTNNSFKSSDTNLYYKKYQMNIWVSDMMLSCLDLSLLIELKYIKNAV